MKTLIIFSRSVSFGQNLHLNLLDARFHLEKNAQKVIK